MRSVLLFLVFISLGVGARAQTVVCFGDSLTAGTGAAAGEAYPDFLREDLQAAGYRGTVVNAGVPGNTSAEGLARMPGVLARHPTVVVVEFGINDALEKTPIAETEANLRRMIDALEAAHVRVVAAGLDALPFLPPNRGPYVPPTLDTPEMRAFYGLYPRLARAYKLPLVPYLLQGVYGNVALMSPDYLHPNGAGYRRVAETVLPYVEKVLGAPKGH